MKIIDFEKKGNVVRFYLGDDGCTDYWGDDWNDTPYECNAGLVSPEYIKGYADVAFPFDDLVLEPADGEMDCGYSKEDFKKKIVPCIIVVPGTLANEHWNNSYSYWVGASDINKYYFGDTWTADYIRGNNIDR